MMDGRRHSVDIPISRALVALRRVRSLRDPSTNSMSKFSALIENANWETNSNNGISLRFMNSPQEGASVDKGVVEKRYKPKCLDEYDANPTSSKSKLVNCENHCMVGDARDPTWNAPAGALNICRGKQEELLGLINEVYGHDTTDKGLDLACVTPSNRMEDVDSCSEMSMGSSQVEKIKHTASERKSQYRIQRRSCGVGGDIESHASTPRNTGIDAYLEGSSPSRSLFANEVDADDHSQDGCSISCCWSGTPKFKRSVALSEVEDRPLLVEDVNEANRYGWKDIWRDNESTPYSDTQKQLGQRLKPKSFNELVGQDVVTKSLHGSISTGKIPSVYLFHGPHGTGKTSASRILAAALNCLMLKEHGPCGFCRECTVLFSGWSRDVKEVDSLRINRTDRVRSLLKNAAIPPESSRFKVFIVDECQLLHAETWAMILTSLEKLPQHIVFIMITSELDKLPRSALSRSQRYHFPKIKDADIANRLGEICVEEGLVFDQVAIEFIAAKSNGSLRDAEMMLDQLSLLGKRITMSLAYELMGTVSDDELLDLLDLALSSDTSNTVIRARELMRSRIDPMQLISQLANLIMDILSGQTQELNSEARRKFSEIHTSETDLHKLSHALKLLSETEKQLRMSKNQTTWLTVALLQLSSADSSSLDERDSKCCPRNMEKDIDGDCCSRPSTEESKKHFIHCSCDCGDLSILDAPVNYRERLDSIWKRATELCRSKALKKFLMKRGSMSSLRLNQGCAMANLDFSHPDYVTRAEKSWKLIASSLQSILGCNVEIRINYVPCAAESKRAKVKRPSFSLFSCSRRMLQKTRSIVEQGSDSDYSDYTFEQYTTMAKANLACPSDCRSQMLHTCDHRVGAVSTIRNADGNILSVGTDMSQCSPHDLEGHLPDPVFDCSGREAICGRHHVISSQEPEVQSNCFPQVMKAQKMSNMPDTRQMICHDMPEEKKIASSIPGKMSTETISFADERYLFCSTDNYTSVSRDADKMRESPDVLCWRTPVLPIGKACERRHGRQRPHVVGWVLPCGAAK
ncbi:protein STICHEL-like 2 [Rhodamnia argentea]|uniref:DNA-directed DNA polymerase n=1 Tax=Rhodamnia argentea TaxID=178133 RepID=A0A8B8Q560_9MYRT|nr:protein STICHEL-like 2 [Rhodamnia argentea]XP_030542226.1 protein STICHEL-like 2 [Rhodamnia argentea]